MSDGTHFRLIRGKIRMAASDPSNPQIGDEYFNTANNYWMRYTGNNWIGFQFTTSSTSTTTSSSTSTSTTTTTTSTSTSTTTSTSTSTTTTI